MHLLGTSVLAFLLLPLTLSCKSTKSKEKISDDYKHIISRQLEHIKLNIESQLKKANMTCSAGHTPKVNSTRQIHALSCCTQKISSSQPQLEPELTNLVTHINGSLGCLCCSQQSTQRIHTLTCCIQKISSSLPQLEPELTNLVTHINGSLGCLNKHPNCGHRNRTPKQPLCKLKKLLDRIKNAYEQFNSSP